MITQRRYDLDWWRVISILLVYVHHICMPFNGDDYHIMNNTSSTMLDDVMVFFEQFRLPLLFLISGTGTLFAFRKRSWWQFIKERTRRLLLPLIFGILVIVPPQTYFEFINDYDSYWDVYQHFTWQANHLWFIENLFIMSLVLIPLIRYLKSPRSNRLIKFLESITSKKAGIFLWVVPLLVLYIILKHLNASDAKDIMNPSVTFYYGFFFVAGMLFTSSKHIWHHLNVHRTFNALAFLGSTLLFYGYYLMPDAIIEGLGLSIATRWNIWYVVCCLVGWSLVTTLLGYGQCWFAKGSKLLYVCNEAIYPFYILHQTVIIIVGYYIIKLDLHLGYKVALLLMITFPVIVLLYALVVYPFAITRIFFGMKPKQK